MSLIPAFEIGLWNAWILMLYMLVHAFLLSLVFKDALKKTGSSGDIPNTNIEKRINTFRTAILVLAFIYSVFLPLKLGTTWFYIGLPICLLGLILYTIIMVNWVTTPPDEPITKGIYRYSRHPMYLTPFLVFIGVGIASASWIFLLCSIAFIILPPFFVKPEERFLFEKYGDSYREYMNKTPRWVGIPKSGGK